MSERAEEFIRDWIADNVQAEAFVDEDGDGDDPRPALFARACQAEAEAQGIYLGELEEASGSLESQMFDAINRSANAEVSRLAANDR